MNISDLKRILISFADNQSDVIINKGEILAAIRGETIQATIKNKDGELYIVENEVEEKVLYWIANRIANLQQLAQRIIDYTRKSDSFVNPTGKLLDDIEIDPTETEKYTENVVEELQKKLGEPIPGTSNVLYLTSDAGEGKTTIINELARKQAENYINKSTNWLLIPIPLGGRPFLRFDDIVIASLVNRLRFRSFYYDSFIELIRLGVIIPGFDGFEEMFMESSTGEALSATGSLMSKLNSSGSILIAARKAYFDYKSFNSQARLFDSIGTNSVSFSKISINRWDKNKFLEYSILRNIEEGEEIYEIVERKLTNSHPLLTRPVLVNQLLDVVKDANDIQNISSSLETTSNYFPVFVDAIIKREAETKWIDRSGEPFKPLLNKSQHYDILSTIAEEMWLNNTDSLQESVLDLIAEIYCESLNLSASLSRQVKERLKQHALIIKSDINQNQYRFDHDEFKEYFLGIAFAKRFQEKKALEIKHLMRKGVISYQTGETIVISLKSQQVDISDYLKLLNTIQVGEGSTSFIRENNGLVSIKLINNESLENDMIDNYIFPTDALSTVKLSGVIIKNSYFQSTSLKVSSINNCIFDNCTFDRLEYDNSASIENVILKDCLIAGIYNTNLEVDYYDPYHINLELENLGFTIRSSNDEIIERRVVQIDRDLDLVDRALRRFLRSTQVNDTIFRMRLGSSGEYFIQDLIPILIENNILQEVDYIGGGKGKRRFKLSTPFEVINEALKKSEGSFNRFLELANNNSNG
ncbi:hypothetical protein LX87_05694 [Larkinella arboricola]|uniref:NACHT domain-containing protein n=1 Tax=Larkinella arboricola TaxID=643671 RepID=A0A327WIM3_LARAB|nr:hypothetical protein [Larkinella arboricola]RAJ89757.1 hypothetical protein LX87_05694 [Larkinella arboricola]